MIRPQKGLLYVLFLTSICLCFAFAQEDTVRWEINLPAATVTSDWLNPFTTGNAIRGLQIEQSKTTLADALREESSLYLRDYGNQQLSSISFRGTSASHTQVLWHGLPVNSPALGQSDLSTWPIGLLSSIALHPGNSSSLYGSGAIGGAILINPSISEHLTNDWSASIKQGSFGLWNGAVSAEVLKNRLQVITKFQASAIQNDFEIRSPRLRKSIIQTNAQVGNLGFSQGLTWQRNHQAWHAQWMFTKNDRNVQPGITSLNQRNKLTTLANRSVVTQEIHKAKWQAKTSVGWMLDETIYNDSLQTPSQVFSFVHRSNLLLQEQWMVQMGGLIQHAKIRSNQLVSGANQLQWEPFASLTWYPTSKIQLTTNSRWLGNKQALRWVPAFSASYKRPFNLPHVDIDISWSSGYRYPTLNDQYWIPGGNPNLLSEKSRQFESHVSWAKNEILIGLTAFDIYTQDQIIWLPNDDNIWSPINVRSTRNQGIEAKVRIAKHIGKIQHESTLNGSWIAASLQEEQTPLPYVPKIQGNWIHRIRWNHWNFRSHLNYTSLRFTTLDGLEAFSLPQFLLLNLTAGYEAAAILKEKSFVISTSIKNATNTYYELQSSLAMPGINYELHITIK